MSNCPVCKSEDVTFIGIASPSGYVDVYHSPSGTVSIQVCKQCGVLFLSKNSLKKIRSVEKKKRKE